MIKFRKIKIQLRAIMILIASLGILNGCALSNAINTGHPDLISNKNIAHATVYIVRPPLQRTRGVADGNVKVELNEIPLINLGTSEYTVVRVKPGPTDVIMRSLSYLTTKPMPVEVWRARRIEFEAGKTYYLEAHFTQEEFRGTYYVPTLTGRKDLQQGGALIRPIGALAKQTPLYDPPPVIKHETVNDDDV